MESLPKSLSEYKHDELTSSKPISILQYKYNSYKFSPEFTKATENRFKFKNYNLISIKPLSKSFSDQKERNKGYNRNKRHNRNKIYHRNLKNLRNPRKGFKK